MNRMVHGSANNVIKTGKHGAELVEKFKR
jgi:hypothetical protein